MPDTQTQQEKKTGLAGFLQAMKDVLGLKPKVVKIERPSRHLAAYQPKHGRRHPKRGQSPLKRTEATMKKRRAKIAEASRRKNRHA